ncbi:MAG TPA: Gfo/Idh/MocA family oxidoreductase [Candidatus Limnocylindrales bacterium]
MAERTPAAASGGGPVRVGLVGAGNISTEYLRTLARCPDVRVVAIGDLLPDAARARAAEFGIATSGEPAAVLDHPDVEIVVNLTIPAVHAEVAGEAIRAGRHVWNEKPLAIDRESGRRVLDAAAAAGVRLGCAPDTFLGDALQAARRAIADGEIGRPLTALALFQSPGPDSWHPNPAFLFQLGAGPLFDLGPYYLTALVQALGPVSRVAAVASVAQPVRVVGSGPRKGERFDVTAPSHVGALLEFEAGSSAQAVFSFDSAQPRTLLEINGTEGTLLHPDPNEFDGDVAVRRRGTREATVVARTRERSRRGTGVLELARAIREDRPHRASGELGYHVLDVMVSIGEAIERRAFVDVESRVSPAPPLPDDWDPTASTLGG